MQGKSIQEKISDVKLLASAVLRAYENTPAKSGVIQISRKEKEGADIYRMLMHISWDDLKDALALFGIYAKIRQVFYKGKMLAIV